MIQKKYESFQPLPCNDDAYVTNALTAAVGGAKQLSGALGTRLRNSRIKLAITRDHHYLTQVRRPYTLLFRRPIISLQTGDVGQLGPFHFILTYCNCRWLKQKEK